MADTRQLERTSEPGVFRRHTKSCKRTGRCKCPYVATWRDRGQPRKRMFDTFDLAREHRAKMTSGLASRQAHSTLTLDAYYEQWLPNYRGRTARGLEESTRSEYETSFRLHILPYNLARQRLRDITPPDIRDWLTQLERAGASPTTIRKAKAALSVLLATAVEDGAIPHNPANGVRYIPTQHATRQHPRRKRRALNAQDVLAILGAVPEQWRVFFMLLAQTGLRIGELLALTWDNVHLDDPQPHIIIVEQIYRGQRKRLKTETSQGRLPLSTTMASWLAELKPPDAQPNTPVFTSSTGTPLNYANLYNRILRPALIAAGIAVKTGETKNGNAIWDYQGVAFHAFRKACGSLLLHHGKNLKQVQGWLRHAQLSTTMNIYIQQVDDTLGGAETWETILPAWGNTGATQPPQPATNTTPAHDAQPAQPSQNTQQPQPPATPRTHS